MILVVVVNVPSSSLAVTVYFFMVYSSLKLRAVLSFDLAEDILSPRARCNNCGVKGSDTYQKVDTGNSDSAMDGAGVTLPAEAAGMPPPCLNFKLKCAAVFD